MKAIKQRLFLALGLMSLCSPAFAAGRLDGPAEAYLLIGAGVAWGIWKIDDMTRRK